ncbi:MAG: c-type cytochrome [Holophagales bacterium]|nr:c-type cytochrome [Holophagales bacterium]MYD23401.1 c-type cytochrome [Holophagales bacterium]MYI33384.1 c-type cytochrome [Holophagales bacterium]
MQSSRSSAIVSFVPLICLFATAALGVRVQAQTGSADPPAPVVPGYEHLRLAGAASDAELGELLLGELNCLSCHEPTPALARRIPVRAAPDLDRIAERATGRWLADYLMAPHVQKPGSAMPEVLHSLEPDDREDAVRTLVGYLAHRGANADPDESSSDEVALGDFPVHRFQASVERGRRLFHAVGCVACHAPEGAEGTGIPSVPLPDLDAKTSVTALVEFLLDPRAARPGGRMPPLHLEREEAEAITVYLLRGQTPLVTERRSGFEFEYYLDPEQDEDVPGFFNRPAPDLDALRPAGVGRIATLSLALPLPMNSGNHAFRFSGLLRLPAAGAYTFTLASDRRSGSSLRIGDGIVATKPPFSRRETEVSAELEAGDHPVEVTYFIRGSTGQPFVDARLDGAALPEPTPLHKVASHESVRLRPADGPAAPNRRYEENGSMLFARYGCSACHTSPGVDPERGRSYAVSRARAPDLEALDPEKALAEPAMHGGETSPRYRLATHQKQAIRAALAALADPPPKRRPEDEITFTMASFNCFACHQRRIGEVDVGGPDPVRARHFRVVDDQDLGDEGRLPPPLHGVGGKLKPGALRSILTGERLHVRRDFMEVRMPGFPAGAAERLADALDSVDALPGDLDEPPVSATATEHGLELIGTGGMGCVTCHDIHVHPAPGISTIDLATAYDRLRPGWVERLLRDPAAIRPGTRMPAYWPEGEANFPDLGGGTTGGQIEALWSFLSLGASMPAPEGMDIGSELVLVPDQRPLVFRTHMIDVGPRAIAIGYPENVHAAFDANTVRLAKVWRGAFFDAKGTWQGRAGQFFGPYGTDVLNLPAGPAFADLDDIDSPWPATGRYDRNVGGRFLGYRLDDLGRPSIRYRLGDVVIEEAPLPLPGAGGANLIRRFRLAAGTAPRPLFLLLAEGEEIVPGPERTWSVDGTLEVSLFSEEDFTPIVRDSQGVRQLLQRIELEPHRSLELDVTLSW